MKNGDFALQYENSFFLFLKFSVKGDEVKVHGPLGAASYIDKTMTRDEARKLWAEKVTEGYHQVPFKTAPRDWWFWN